MASEQIVQRAYHLNNRDWVEVEGPYARDAREILRAILQQELSAEQVAQAMCLNVRSVYRFVRGSQHVKPIYMERLRKATGVQL